jgi:uncharacterized protein YdaU (DUF1376 family)
MMLYVADYLADTTHLSTEQHGAYLLILFAMWRRGGFVPADERVLAKLSNLSLKRWRQTGGPVLALMEVQGEQITQRRLLSELQKARLISEVKRAAAYRSHEVRALKAKEPHPAHAELLHEQSGLQNGGNQNQNHNHKVSKKEDLASAAPSPSKPKAKNGTRWPDGHKVPPAWIEQTKHRLAELGRPIPDLSLEAERFASYWSAQAGQKATKLNWEQTFYNWCLNARTERRPNQQGRATRFDAIAEGARRAIARFEKDERVDGPSAIVRLALPDAA